MAMTGCRECAREVSDAAAACPHCGVGRPSATQAARQTRADIIKVALLSVAGLAILLVVVSALGI